jgi:cytochrome P450
MRHTTADIHHRRNTHSFALFRPPYWDDPHRVGAFAREQAAVCPATLPSGLPVWVVTRYAEGRAALADPRLSKNAAAIRSAVAARLKAAGVDPAAAHVMFSPHMLFADGEDHTRLRRLVSTALSARRMAAMGPHVEALAEGMVEALAADAGPVDLVDRIAFPLPLTVICDLLGVPGEDRPAVREWSQALMDEDPAEVVHASEAMARYVEALIERRRARPCDDLVSALVAAGSADDRLTPDELLGTVVLLIVAGHETATATIANAAVTLLAERRWAALATEPEAVPVEVEELLRYENGVRSGTYRIATEDVPIGDAVIPAGALVLVSLISANRDPAAFFDPDDYRPGQRPSPAHPPHLAFGHGPHYCLGAPLARIEIAAALRQLTRHYPRAVLAAPAPYTRSPITIGRRHLFVQLNP